MLLLGLGRDGDGDAERFGVVLGFVLDLLAARRPVPGNLL
jgi:hypothetical protein